LYHQLEARSHAAMEKKLREFQALLKR